MRFMVPQAVEGRSWDSEDGWDTIYLPEGYTPEDVGAPGFTPGDYRGLIARYSAPGYLDATDWTPIESREDVEDFIGFYGDGDDEHWSEDFRALMRALAERD